MRSNIKRNGFVLSEITASLLLAACGGGTPTDISGAVPLASGSDPTSTTAATGTTEATDSSALTRSEASRRRNPLMWSLWSFCAPEGGICKVAAPTTVRYGAGGAYAYRNVQDEVACSNDVFGDPLPGAVKECDVAMKSSFCCASISLRTTRAAMK